MWNSNDGMLFFWQTTLFSILQPLRHPTIYTQRHIFDYQYGKRQEPSMTYIYLVAIWLVYAFLSVISICLLVIARFYLYNGAAKLDKCGLYMGKVSHTRLKGDRFDAFDIACCASSIHPPQNYVSIRIQLSSDLIFY